MAQSIASIVAAVPATFTIAHGTGQAAAINQDGTLNSRDTPASRGSIVTLYATGEGVRHPGESLASPVLPVSLTIGGKRAEILYAGAAPGFAGLMQINARVPASPGGAGFYPVLLTVGSYTSPRPRSRNRFTLVSVRPPSYSEGMPPVALTIAGSDRSGGAGIQADLKTFHQFEVYGEAVITLITVQNTRDVLRVECLDPALVADQLKAVLEDIPPDAAKTGALGDRAIVEVVAKAAERFVFH